MQQNGGGGVVINQPFGRFLHLISVWDKELFIVIGHLSDFGLGFWITIIFGHLLSLNSLIPVSVFISIPAVSGADVVLLSFFYYVYIMIFFSAAFLYLCRKVVKAVSHRMIALML